MSFSSQELEILFEDNHLLVINKPAMLPTMGVAESEPSLLKLAKEYIRDKYQKPGNVYLGIVSRLDTPVTGVIIVARTSKAAARLSEEFRERRTRKLYWAVVEGRPRPSEGTLEHYLRKDERHRKMHVTRTGAPDAQIALLTYRTVRSNADLSLLEIELQTGRKHQIRVQMAAHGFPIVADRKYGSSRTFPSGIALHARRLTITHPVRKETMEFVAPLPILWQRNREFADLLDDQT